jgi:DNA-binding transcriptional ArsR family regulator
MGASPGRPGERETSRPGRDITDHRVAKALAHPLRLRILAALENERIASPSELSEELDASLGVVSYHVRNLADAGFLELVGTRPRRGATQHYYRAVSRPAVTQAAWDDLPTTVQDDVVGATLAAVGRAVNKAAADGGFHRHDAHVAHLELTLDEQGFAEASARFAQLREDLVKIAARHAGSPESTATAVLLLFDTLS